MSSHQTKTISSSLCWGQAPLDVSRIWTRAHLPEEAKPKLLLNCAASADGSEDRREKVQSGPEGSSRDRAQPDTLTLRGQPCPLCPRYPMVPGVGSGPGMLPGLEDETVAWEDGASSAQLLKHHPSSLQVFPARFPEGTKLLPPRD